MPRASTAACWVSDSRHWAVASSIRPAANCLRDSACRGDRLALADLEASLAAGVPADREDPVDVADPEGLADEAGPGAPGDEATSCSAAAAGGRTPTTPPPTTRLAARCSTPRRISCAPIHAPG